MTYTRHRDTQETLQIIDRLDLDTERGAEDGGDGEGLQELYRRFGLEDRFLAGTLSPWQRLRPRAWCLFEEINSSTAARVRYYSFHSQCKLLIRIVYWAVWLEGLSQF